MSDRDARARPRSSWLLLVIVGLCGALSWWSTTILPRTAIDRMSKETRECSQELNRTGLGDPEDCRRLASKLELAGMLPWTRDSALHQANARDRTVAADQLLVASVRDLDREVRDRAAREWIALEPGTDPDSDWFSFLSAYQAGALEVVVEAAALSGPHVHDEVITAALVLGDWPTAVNASSLQALDEWHALDAAIVACLFDERAVAIAHLDEAKPALRRRHDFLALKSQWIAQRCELQNDEPLDQHRRDADNNERAMTVARMALALDDPLAWTAVANRMLLNAIADGLRPVGEGVGPVVVSELEAGARRLDALVALAPNESTRTILIRGATSLASLAAAERSWRGQDAEAHAMRSLIVALVAGDGFQLFDVDAQLAILACLEPTQAVALARSISSEQLAHVDADTEARRRVALALVFERAGELERATKLAAEASALRPRGLTDGSAALWVHGSLLHRSGGALTPESLADMHAADRGTAAWYFVHWWSAVTAQPAAQPGLRWQLRDDRIFYYIDDPHVLALALELAAHAAPADGREAWLDRVSMTAKLDPLTLIRTRKAVAERLGDADSAERWRKREAALLELLQDDRAAGLYRLFGRYQ